MTRLVALGPRRVGLLAESGAELGIAIFRVWRGGQGLARLLQPPASPPESPPLAAQPILKDVAWAINAVGARLPRDPTCLMRALAARAMLTRRGIRGVIRIGISEDFATFRAHAWVEAGGRPVVGWIAGERFAVIAQMG